MKKIIAIIVFLSIAWLTLYAERVVVGAEQTKQYLPLLKGKRVALMSNHTGIVIQGKDTIHTLDLLLNHGVNVTAIFSPEHGFRGTAREGEHVASSVDEKTGIPILSLYDGKSYRPSKEAMATFDILITDIQDVGLRFYTYYITMFRLMDACAHEGKQFIVFDRPNPNGYYVDGPILDMKHKSGVGALPIPVVHGMTLGELALMINGEYWLYDSLQVDLTMGNRKYAGSALEPLATAFRDPVLTDLRIMFAAGTMAETYPRLMKNLYKGRSVTLKGRCPARIKELVFTLKGLSGSKAFESLYRIDISSVEKASETVIQDWRAERIVTGRLLR